MAESNQKHMKPSWATGQTVSIREESIIDNGSFLGGQFSCLFTSSSSVTVTQLLTAGSSDCLQRYNKDHSGITQLLHLGWRGTTETGRTSRGWGKGVHPGSCKSPVKLSERLPVVVNGVRDKVYYV